MRNVIEYIGGRKFLLALIALFLVVFVLDLSGQQKAEYITWLIGLFSAANAIQKKATPPAA